ncbi:MAG: nicotinate (nicotinamide) nucleotide adenylyltransferase [Candidatus Eremiobacteraeota bacterium]|nr:nicotinate (nicotinamide) nucleotide adenylyltransferase [Candidatus Eremiobacteraeota bacterium]
MSAPRLGLFGGTFDPVHNAHLFVAESARVALALDRIVFLPTNGSAHYRSRSVASAADRLAMLRAALAPNPHFALDDADLAPESTGYTADVLPRLRERYGDAALTFIAGNDSLLESPWQRFGDVLAALDAFAIAPRAGREPASLQGFIAGLPPQDRNKIVVLDLPALNESSTFVRAQAARGGNVRYLVPDAVARYIAEHELYRTASA